MGNVCSPMDEEEALNRQISRGLQRELRQLQSQPNIRLVLLGPGASGKSTVFKQANIVYRGGFSDEEKAFYRVPLHTNCLDVIQVMAAYMRNQHPGRVDDALDKKLKPIAELDRTTPLLPEHGERLLQLWHEEAFQKTYSERHLFQMPDNAEYLMANVGRICEEGYVPTQEDIVRSRVRTSGIVKTEVMIEGVRFEIVDVGGQRGERRKWVSVLDGVRAVLYVAAISEYDQVCVEDSKQNRVTEALELFAGVCKWLPNTPIILFLNKRDLLEQKLNEKRSPLSALFPEYEGGWDVNAAIKLMKRKFLQADPNDEREVYVHVTSAVDTNLMERVFQSVRSNVIQRNIALGGLA